MYSTINHQIMQARVADLHRQAQQDALARAARQGRLLAKAQVRASHAPAPRHHRTPRAHRLSRPRLTGTGGPASGGTHMCWSALVDKLRCGRKLRRTRGIDAIGGRAPQALLPGQGWRRMRDSNREGLLPPVRRGPLPSRLEDPDPGGQC